MIAQQRKDLFVEPRRMAELERCAALRRQQREKLAQPRCILLEVRRQLKQQWSQALLQRLDNFEQRRHRSACVLEPLKMRYPLRRLEHELEIGEDLARP